MAIAPGVSAKGTASGALTATTTGVTTQATGSTILLLANWSRNSGTFSTIADSKSNTYTQINTQLDWEGANGGSRAYYSQNATGGASHTGTITLTGSNSPITLFLLEITGGLTSGILDQQDRREDTASPYTLAAGLTTTQADELVVTCVFGNTGSNPGTHAETGIGSSTIQVEETNGASFWTGAVATSVKSSTGTFNPSWTESGASAAAVWEITFKATTTAATSLLVPVRARFYPSLIQF